MAAPARDEGVTPSSCTWPTPGGLHGRRRDVLPGAPAARARVRRAGAGPRRERRRSSTSWCSGRWRAGDTAPRYHALTRPAGDRGARRPPGPSRWPRWPARRSTSSTSPAPAALAARARGARPRAPGLRRDLPAVPVPGRRGLRPARLRGREVRVSPPLRGRRPGGAVARPGGGDLQVVATDHCPFTLHGPEGRAAATTSRRSRTARPGIETRMMLLCDGGVRARADRRSALRRADRRRPGADLRPLPAQGHHRRGRRRRPRGLGPGAHARSRRALHMRVDYSPYEGRVVRGGPVVVMSRGEVIVDRGEWKGRPGRGQFLKRAHGAALHLSQGRHRIEWRPPCASTAVSPPPCFSWPLPPRLRTPHPRRAGASGRAASTALPSPDNMREAMRRLSARPHHVGSPYGKENAEWILAQFRRVGARRADRDLRRALPDAEGAAPRDGGADAVPARPRRAGARGRSHLRPEGRAAPDLQRLLDRRRRHRRRWST